MDERSIHEYYVIDFLDHLRGNSEHRRQFLVFYPIWKRIREDSLSSMRQLVPLLTTTETVCEAGKAASAGGAVYGILAGLNEFMLTRCVDPFYAVLAFAAHGLKLGFSAAQADVIYSSRQKVSGLLAMDLSETKAFVRMGLDSHAILRVNEHGADDGRRNVTLSVRPQALAIEVLQRDECGQDVASTTGNSGDSKTRDADVTVAASTGNIRNAVIAALPCAAQLAFDYTAMVQNDPIYNRLFNCFYIPCAALSILRDTYDIARSLQALLRLIHGIGSVSQNEVQEIINWLDLEYQYVNEIYDALRDM